MDKRRSRRIEAHNSTDCSKILDVRKPIFPMCHALKCPIFLPARPDSWAAAEPKANVSERLESTLHRDLQGTANPEDRCRSAASSFICSSPGVSTKKFWPFKGQNAERILPIRSSVRPHHFDEGPGRLFVNGAGQRRPESAAGSASNQLCTKPSDQRKGGSGFVGNCRD